MAGTGGTLPTAVPDNYGREYIIKHYSGKCIDVKYSNTLYLTSKCTKRFYLTKNNKLMDVDQKRCFTHKTGGDDSLIKSTACNQQGTGYERTSYGSIKQISSGRCIHPFGGLRYPREGQNLVLYKGCRGRKVIFTFEPSK